MIFLFSLVIILFYNEIFADLSHLHREDKSWAFVFTLREEADFTTAASDDLITDDKAHSNTFFVGVTWPFYFAE